jgi:DNA repair protein RadD
MAEYKLRDYQVAAVEAAVGCVEKKHNGILTLPTGSGKSLVIAQIAKEIGGRILVLQPSKEILEQNYEKMEGFGFWNLGVYSASMGRKDRGQITFATIGSIIRKKHLFKEFQLTIIDECHKVNAKNGMYKNFIEHLEIQALGLTATPYRMKSYRDMHSGEIAAESRFLTRTRPRIFNKVVHVTQLKDLFDQGYLCELDYDIDMDYHAKDIKGNSTGQGYDEFSLKRYNKTMSIPAKIADAVHKTDRSHYLAFTQFRSETKEVLEYLRQYSISCAEVSADTKKDDRERIIRQFRAGRIQCVVNVGVLTTGFDFPELDCIILGRPTRSVALYYQMCGRGIRPYPDKRSCLLVDLCDNVNRFGRIETFEIYDSTGKGMWRLKSDAGNLTGVDIITGTDKEIKSSRKAKDTCLPISVS